MQKTGNYQDTAACQQLANIDFKPDQVKQQYQAEFRNGLDVGRVGYQPRAHRADYHPGDKEGGNLGYLQPDTRYRQHACEDDAEADVMHQR